MNRRAYCGLIGATALSGCSAITSDFSNDQVGETFTIDDRLDLTVDRIESQSEGRVLLGNNTPISGGNGITFVMPHLIAENTTEEVQSVPPAANFQILSDGVRQRTYQAEYADIMSSVELRIEEPISGDLFPQVSEIGPEEETSGWLVFTVPNSGSTVRLEVRVDDEVVTDWVLPVET